MSKSGIVLLRDATFKIMETDIHIIDCFALLITSSNVFLVREVDLDSDLSFDLNLDLDLDRFLR